MLPRIQPSPSQPKSGQISRSSSVGLLNNKSSFVGSKSNLSMQQTQTSEFAQKIQQKMLQTIAIKQQMENADKIQKEKEERIELQKKTVNQLREKRMHEIWEEHHKIEEQEQKRREIEEKLKEKIRERYEEQRRIKLFEEQQRQLKIEEENEMQRQREQSYQIMREQTLVLMKQLAQDKLLAEQQAKMQKEAEQQHQAMEELRVKQQTAIDREILAQERIKQRNAELAQKQREYEELKANRTLRQEEYQRIITEKQRELEDKAEQIRLETELELAKRKFDSEEIILKQDQIRERYKQIDEEQIRIKEKVNKQKKHEEELIRQQEEEKKRQEDMINKQQIEQEIFMKEQKLKQIEENQQLIASKQNMLIITKEHNPRFLDLFMPLVKQKEKIDALVHEYTLNKHKIDKYERCVLKPLQSFGQLFLTESMTNIQNSQEFDYLKSTLIKFQRKITVQLQELKENQIKLKNPAIQTVIETVELSQKQLAILSMCSCVGDFIFCSENQSKLNAEFCVVYQQRDETLMKHQIQTIGRECTQDIAMLKKMLQEQKEKGNTCIVCFQRLISLKQFMIDESSKATEIGILDTIVNKYEELIKSVKVQVIM
ncbi:Hypothetical_protein [Hexamita inflata]|uniref:Hypothetical_protein n=1 Tax=Hexamita inflata TaxID=28002 RepID=A0AA86NN99_9EUKA|nr:Hypothetical protein HINF_LOCUS9500 [Hexamita inflata]